MSFLGWRVCIDIDPSERLGIFQFHGSVFLGALDNPEEAGYELYAEDPNI